MYLCCLLIACSGYSQIRSAESTARYPCYIYLHGDTLGAFTLGQMRHIAATYLKLDECDSIATQLVAERDARQHLDLQTDSAIRAYQSIVMRDQRIFDTYQHQLSLKDSELGSLRRSARLTRIKSWAISIPVVGTISVGTFLIGYLITHK